jgi:hypothetical protein
VTAGGYEHLTKHNFQDVFKKWQKRWKQCIHADRDYFEGGGGGGGGG